MKRGNSIVIFASILVILGILLINQKPYIVDENKDGYDDISHAAGYVEGAMNCSNDAPISSLMFNYFSYLDQNNNFFTTNHLKNKITIAYFFFTSCPVICPRMNEYMKQLNQFYGDTPNIQFLAISVDPTNDTRSVINDYIDKQKLRYDNAFFLESDEESISKLLEEGFLLSGEGLPGLHSTKFILINSNAEISGYYEPSNSNEFNQLKKDVTHLLNTL